MSKKKIQWHHRESNPRPSGLQHSASTNSATAYPDRSICIFLFNGTTLQVFVTYLTGALYVHPLWFYKHQHSNRVRSKLFVSCQRWWFQWRFATILVNCAPSGEMHNYCTPHIIKKTLRIFLSIGATTYCYLKCVTYDKLLKPWQSFWITLYVSTFMWWQRCNSCNGNSVPKTKSRITMYVTLIS